jgi:hypothetical protein
MRGMNQVTGRLAPGWTARRARHFFTHPRRAPVRDWEREVEARAQRVPLAVGWSTLRWSPDAAGPHRGRVLCMHGWEGRATQFGPLADRLVACGFEVVALDGPGHGHSPEEVAHPVAFARALLDTQHELGSFNAGQRRGRAERVPAVRANPAPATTRNALRLRAVGCRQRRVFVGVRKVAGATAWATQPLRSTDPLQGLLDKRGRPSARRQSKSTIRTGYRTRSGGAETRDHPASTGEPS